MTKEELIALTLKQLSENIINAPECFELESNEVNPTRSYMSVSIIWRPRVNLDGTTIADPTNNPRTVIVSFNTNLKEIGCYIFLKDIGSTSAASSVIAEASAHQRFGDFPLWLYKNYRQFNKLKKQLIAVYVDRDNAKYLNKLCSVFPGTFEEDLLGKK